VKRLALRLRKRTNKSTKASKLFDREKVMNNVSYAKVFRVRELRRLVASTALMACIGVASAAGTCPFDTSDSDAVNDGLILTRFALGITGAPLIANTKYATIAGFTGAAAQNNIECVACGLDVDNNGQINTVDSTVIARHLAGFKGASLTNGLGLSASTANFVNSFIVNGCQAGGAINAFVQGGNSFGAPAVLGTNDAQSLTVKTGGSEIKLSLSNGDGLRINFDTSSPNVINGNRDNFVNSGLFGATIGGGGSGGIDANRVTNSYGTVAGGRGNAAGTFAVVSGGTNNLANGNASSVSGGDNNIASGIRSIVAGGFNNEASGENSFAAGRAAKADLDGSFVWADASTTNPFRVSANYAAGFGTNTFNARATGGVFFVTTVNSSGVGTTYCFIGRNGTGWTCASDRSVKERVVPIVPAKVLAGVLAMPVSTWSIIGSKVRQMGPMAQDFHRLFGLGDTDKAINSIDVGGVAFAAIQGLNQKLTHEVKSLQAKLASKDEEAAKLKARLAAIERKLGLN
jgi:hypothetical protein